MKSRSEGSRDCSVAAAAGASVPRRKETGTAETRRARGAARGGGCGGCAAPSTSGHRDHTGSCGMLGRMAGASAARGSQGQLPNCGGWGEEERELRFAG